MEGFHCEKGKFVVTDDVKHYFQENGFIIVRQLLSGEELGILKHFVETDEAFVQSQYTRDDGEGGRARIVLWNDLQDDVTGVIARTHKVAGTMEQLLGGEVYHYHSKIIMKNAYTGGAHIWHQDYGYWYENGCLYPDMGTVFTAIDKADRSNGCLKILRGSHKMGRIQHVPIGDQAGADPDRVKEIMKVCELVHVELDPGDSVFFHSNMIHRSEQNHSPNRRWAFLCAYNRATNNPFKEHHHPQYSKLIKVDNSTILEFKDKKPGAQRNYFKGPKEDVSLKSLQDRAN